MQEYLLKYNNDCIESFKTNLTKVKKSFNSRAIHTLRLSVKKINALFSFLEVLDTSFEPKKSLRKVNKLFIISGNLRDTQIQTSLIKKYKKDYPDDVVKLISYLGKKRKKVQKKLRNQLGKIEGKDYNSVKKQIELFIMSYDGNTLTKSCIDFTNQTLLNIKNLASMNLNDDKLHEIRIYLKMFIYTLSLLSKNNAMSNIEKSSLKALNILQQTIGDWHDHDLLYQKVKKLAEKKIQYASILSSIESTKKELETKTLSKLITITSYQQGNLTTRID